MVLSILACGLGAPGVCNRGLTCRIRGGRRRFGSYTGWMFMLEPQDLGQRLVVVFE